MGFYAYDSASSPTVAHLAQVLVDPDRNTRDGSFTAAGSAISMTLSAFSSWRVPNCCPDLHYRVHWNWNGAQFQEIPSALFGPVPILVHASPSAAQVGVGQTLTYTVKVTNAGSTPLTQTTVNGVTIQPGTGQDEPTCKAASQCTIGTLNPGATATVVLQVTVTQRISPHIFRFNVNGVYPSGTINVPTESTITVS